MDFGSAFLLACLILGGVAITYIVLAHRREVMKLRLLNTSGEFQDGVREGMRTAATLLRSGSMARVSGPYTPSPDALADMIEHAIPPVPKE